MPFYKYHASNKLGIRSNGFIIADSKSNAISELVERGLFPIKCCYSLKNWTVKVFGSGIKYESLLLFFSHIRYQAKIGLTLIESLTAFSKGDFSDFMIGVVNDVKFLLEQGISVSDAFSRYRHVFGDIAVRFLAVSEQTGDLDASSRNIVNFLELSNKALQYVKQALYYPLFSVLVAFCAIFCCGALLIPQLSIVYQDFGLESGYLNSISSLLNGTDLTTFFKRSIYVVVVFGLAIFILASKYAKFSSKLIDRIPILGKILNKLNLWRFTLTFSSALKAKIAPMKSLEIAVSSVGNFYWKQCFEKAYSMVSEGQAISVSFCQCCSFVPKLLMLAIRIGEENNKLDETLSTFSEMTYSQLELTIKSLSNKLVIFLTVLTGLILLAIVVGFFMPIYSNLLNVGGI
ncbi:MAG: type II secretion system F family protein [Holosporales bacterium]|jgi:type II secretory pathway component PulF|nr:type II secretion system F family protein [Holosporales bacterium]